MRLSLITAAHPPRSTYLAETALSVAAAAEHLSNQGLELEWVVAVDGPGEIPDVTSTPGVVLVRRPMNGGVSAARNTALALCSGDLVMPLDHDDLLDAEGLAALLRDERSTASAWCAGSPRLLDGSWTPHRVREPLLYSPRYLEEHWTSPFPFHPNVVAARREAALEVGGWPALTGNQDLGFVFALNRHHAGWALPYALLGYRQWDEQTVAQDYYAQIKTQDFAFLTAQINAERAASGLGSITAPTTRGSQVRAVGDSAVS